MIPKNDLIGDLPSSNYSKSSLESLTVVAIKAKLREEGLPVSGRKAKLIERLLGGRGVFP